MRGKTFIYTLTSFILLALTIFNDGFNTVFLLRSVLGLSVLIAIIGILQIIRIWRNSNKILNALDSYFLLLNILLIIINC
ncbi:MAG: hypothetical protein K0R54_5356, partial [Clostridiaceae bacterium]|nr:hypothetical protein [Clostridiaceae bacterium]